MNAKSKASAQTGEDQFEQLVVELKDKTIILKVLPFDPDINVDEILRIDYHNIMGEILTFQVIFNRIGNIKAEMQNIVSRAKLDLEVFEAQLYEEYKNKLAASGKATVKDIEAAILRDHRLSIKKKDFFEKVKNFEYCDSLYWSAQNKSSALLKMADKLRPEEFSGELLQDIVNGVMIKQSRKAIK